MATPTNTTSTHTVPEAVLNGPQFLGHPRGLFLLFLVEMWERFSYYGMRGLLVLYLATVMSVKQAPEGTHQNTLLFTQIQSVEVDSKDKPGEKVKEDIKTESTREFAVVVGNVSPPTASGDANLNAPLALSIVPARASKALNPTTNEPIYEPDASQSDGLHVVSVKGQEVSGDTVHYLITNPTSTTYKLTAEIKREPNPAGSHIATKTYFNLNDSSSVVAFEVKPDTERKPEDPQYVLTVAAHTGDSGRNWTDGEAYGLYGWYTGFAYLLPILGGLIADRLIGTHRSMIVGSILITLGHITLGLSGMGNLAHNPMGMSIFIAGLALITIGTGHFKPSVSVMVGQLYAMGDPRRESAFSIFYMGINLGSFLCNLACGWLAAAYGWHYGFAAAAVGMILGLCCYLMGKKTYLPGIGESSNEEGKNKAWMFLPIGLVLAAVVGYLFDAGILAKLNEFVSITAVQIVIGVAAIAWTVWFIAKQPPGDRGPVATIFIYMLFNAVFWLSFEQAGSSLNQFTNRNTDRMLGGIEVETPYFQSINPLLIIIFAPIAGVIWAALARKKKYISQPVKIGFGLIFVGLGYLVMVFAAMQLNTGLAKVGMIYICGCYFLHTVGEIILSPTGLSYVAKTAPKQHMSGLMGIWFISSFVAGLGAGQVAKLVEPIIAGDVKLPWKIGGQADFFLLFVVSSCVAGLLVIALSPLLVRMQRNRGD